MLFFDPTILSRVSYLTSIAAAVYVFGNHSPFPILATFQETLHCAFMLLFVFSCSEKPDLHLLRAQVGFSVQLALDIIFESFFKIEKCKGNEPHVPLGRRIMFHFEFMVKTETDDSRQLCCVISAP